MYSIKNIEFGENFGISEMFEWAEQIPQEIVPLAKFVQFSPNFPRGIILAKNTNNIVGITTINTAVRASNPNVYPYKYLINEYGDLYLQAKEIAYAQKTYDEINEFSYLTTKRKVVHIPIVNEYYDENKEYVPRSNRGEWMTVTLLGKVILEDNGKCKAGEYCTVYSGDDPKLIGTAQPATNEDKFKLYVLERLSEHTILVLMVPQIYSDNK